MGSERGGGGRPSPGRRAAIAALVRVAEDDAWLAPVLDGELARVSDRRDRALATELAYGTLRALATLDGALAPHVARGLAKVEPLALAALRVGAYQLLCLERVPASAAVDASVGVVAAARGQRLASFVNAVLRKVAATRPEAPRRPDHLAAPPWLRATLEASLGAERTAALLAVPDAGPATGLRVRGERDAVARAIGEAAPRAEVRAGEVAPAALLVSHAGDVRELPGFAEGAFVVQEEGAQAVGALLDPRPGERVLDACAGRGGKTLQLADAMGRGAIDAADLHPSKLERLRETFAAYAPPAVSLGVAAVDLAVGAGALAGPYDRVLLDAPCTGLGTLVRRPELLLRRAPGDPARLAALQLAILRRLVPLVRPGGLLVYAVCSPLAEEGAAVVARLLEAEPTVALDRQPVPALAARPDDDGLWRFGPWRGGTDAYTAARLRVGGRA